MTGYFMREEFMVDFIDLWLQQIFSSLSRLVYRGDILIEHKHWSFRKSDFDSVANNLRGNNYPKISQVAWINTKEERIREAKMIGDRIGIVPDLIKINTAIMG
jgi:hypothetical protein